MLLTAEIGIFSCLAMIIGVIFKPRLDFGKIGVDTYWFFPLIGAVALIVTGQCNIKTLSSALTADTAINPLKILVLFISMTFLSIYLDETGFFSYLAQKTVSIAKTSQIKIFVLLYLTVSVLTVFTSNDIIILTFTPFICYFAKNAGINPLPYLVAEFVAANTWSMVLIIGNPTNIYLSSYSGIGFFEYFKVMIVPTIFAGLISLAVLLLVFKKQLSKPASVVEKQVSIRNKTLLWIGLIHLSTCTVLLAVSSYTGWEMWIISLLSAVSLITVTVVINSARKSEQSIIFESLKRSPWQLVPFVLSMFIIVSSLEQSGITKHFAQWLGTDFPVFKYGISSFVASNVINNIPMSVLFCSFLGTYPQISESAAFATIIGSNIGAFLTPVGALAGIMWSNILKKQEVKFGFASFIKYGALISLPALVAALLGLALVLGF